MATAIRGRIVRLTTKAPLIDITVQAIDVATGNPAATTTTSNSNGFYSLTGLTDAVYFANPLIADDDWTIQPDTNVIFGGDLYVPDNTTTPRVQITTATHGGFAILGSGDTYNDSTGAGTYQVLFDYGAATPGMYFANGAAYIGSAGITITGSSSLNVSQSFVPTGGSVYDGIKVVQTTTGAAGGATVSALRIATNLNHSSGTIANVTGIMAAPAITAGATSIFSGMQISTSGTGATTSNGLRIAAVATGGTLTAAISIADPLAAATAYALYITSTAQSVHTGNLRIGSTTAPTTTLDVTGAALVSSTLGVTGATTLSSTLKVSGATSLGGTHTATGVLDIRDTNVIVQALAPFPAIVTGSNNGGALYFGVNATGSTIPTAAIETSWGGATNPQIGIGVIRDALKANILMDYNGDTFIRNGSTNSVVVYRNGQVGIGVTNTTAGRLLWGQYSTAATTADFRWEQTDNTSGSSHALHSIIVGGASSGDPFINFRVAGATDWSIGIDNSVANDPFVLARSGTLGTTNIASFLAGSVTLADPYDIVLGTTTGTKIGTATTQKLGFWNTAPVARAAAYTQTYATATRTHANITATTPSAYAAGANGYSTGAKAQEVHAAVVAHQTDIANVKQVLNQVIDDLQLYGLLA